MQQIKSENENLEEKLPGIFLILKLDANSKLDKLIMLAKHYKVNTDFNPNQ